MTEFSQSYRLVARWVGFLHDALDYGVGKALHQCIQLQTRRLPFVWFACVAHLRGLRWNSAVPQVHPAAGDCLISGLQNDLAEQIASIHHLGGSFAFAARHYLIDYVH